MKATSGVIGRKEASPASSPSERSEAAIAALLLAAAALVLATPVVGRAGVPGLPHVVMILAVACGLASFSAAAVQTLRARPSRPPTQGGP